MIQNHDKSVCKWSVQKDGYCPFEEILNKLVNSHVDKKIRCKSKECLYIILEKTGLKNEREVIEKYEPDMLKPRGPLLKHELLSNINIDDVLHDFSIASIPKKGESNIFINGPFYHIPFVMRDFDKANVSEFRDLNFQDLYDRKFKSFGCVLNTDTWSGNNTEGHWLILAGFLSPQNRIHLEYFNSSSNGLDDFIEIKNWIKKKKSEFPQFKITYEEVVNFPLQGEDSVCCGVWCLLYMKFRLEGKDIKYFYENKIDDLFVDNFRKYLFIS
jgi:hypothetical protein